jgi:hypothetical protein
VLLDDARERAPHRLDDAVDDLEEEGLVDAEELPVPSGAPEQPTEHVAAPSFDGRTPSAIRNVTAREWSAITWIETSSFSFAW